MLPNKFDQYFRDRLLDHSTKPSAGAWKLIHAGLLRHKAFHFWKWWVAGPSVVVVAVTGYVIFAQINKPVKAHADASTHALTQPPAPQTQSVAASDATTPGNATTPGKATTPGNAAAASETPNASNTAATSNTPAPASTTNTSNTPAAATAANPATNPDTASALANSATNLTTPNTTSTASADGTVHKPHTLAGTNGQLSADSRLHSGASIRHPTNGHTPNGNHKPRGAQPGYLASAKPATEEAGSAQSQDFAQHTGNAQSQDAQSQDAQSQDALNQNARNQNDARSQGNAQSQNAKNENAAQSPGSSKPFRPIGLTAQLTIAHPSTRLAVTAKTPNPKSNGNLVVPAHPYHHTSPWRFDGFGSPEYFTFKGFGFSYGAGARVTLVLKEHFTITTGIQYLKVDVTARSKMDSLNQLYPGIFNNIQLPVFFGYTVGNDRFSFTANAGMIFSLYSDAKGFLKYEGWPNRNGPSAYLGFNFATRVGDRISIFAEPYFKCWYPQRSQDLPAQLYSTGISLGLRYDLK